MDKLGQITIDNSLSITLNCQVDQELLTKNFNTIVNALKQLQQGQLLSDSKIKDLMSIKEKIDLGSQKIEKVENNTNKEIKEVSTMPSAPSKTSTDHDNVSNNLASLTKRVEKSEGNILDNIKDINLINSELRDAQNEIEELKKKLNLMNAGSEKSQKESSQSYGINEIAQNLSKQLRKSQENMKNVLQRLSKAEEIIERLEKQLQSLLQRKSGENENNTNTSLSVTINRQLQELKNDLRDKLDGINRKITGLQSLTNHHDKEIGNLKDLIDQLQGQGQNQELEKNQNNNKNNNLNNNLNINLNQNPNQNSNQNPNQNPNSNTNQNTNQNANLNTNLNTNLNNNNLNNNLNNNQNRNEALLSELQHLRKKIEEINEREKKDFKYLQEELNNLKQQLKNLKTQKIESKTSLDEEQNKSHRKLTDRIKDKDRDELNDKVNDLILKVTYLQKIMSGSKNSLSDEKNPQKLPVINRPKKRDPNLTGFHYEKEKQKSGISRKDLAELKAELEVWIKSFLDNSQNRQTFEDLDLKLQEIKRNVQKKADAENTKKGFNFLQNKITQLYLFLTSPQTEDAMIVRRGFNCLSCSKKVEKLKGKLGPKLNWNNMTTTNYSPPRVGYSKPMGDHSMEKEDDL